MTTLLTKQFTDDPNFASDWFKARDLKRMMLEGKPVNKDRLKVAMDTTKETTRLLQSYTAEMQALKDVLKDASKDERTNKVFSELGIIPKDKK